jgi:hypothetical protein
MTPLPFWYLGGRFENLIQMKVLITTNIQYLSFTDNYVGDIQFIIYIIVLYISGIPYAAIR